MPIKAERKSKLNKNDGKKKALALAKEKGKLTYDDLNKILPVDATSEEIDELMVMLNEMDVEITDEFRVDAETQQAQQQKELQARKAQIHKEVAQTKLERADDPVRMYLREMGRVPLLTKDQEVSIAKRIEAAELQLTEVLLNTAYTLKEVQMLTARILAGRLNFAQITEIEEPRAQNKVVRKLPAMMEWIAALDAKIAAQEKRARRSEITAEKRERIAERIARFHAQQADVVRIFHLKTK